MKKCPLINKKCIEHQCQFYVNILGMNPQTGQQIDRWDCAVSWLPILLVENANMTRQATASVDKVAKETRLVAAVAAGGNDVLAQIIGKANSLAIEKKEEKQGA